MRVRRRKSKGLRKKIYLILVGVLVVSAAILFIPSVSIKDVHKKIVVTTGRLSKGETLYKRLRNEGLSPEEINTLIDMLKPFLEPDSYKAGDWYELVMSTGGYFNSFRYFSGPEDVYRVERSTGGEMSAYWEKASLQRRIVGLQGVVKGSFWESMIEQVQNSDLAGRFSNIFAWQIDFLSESCPGDVYKLIWERYYEDGKLVFDGDILAAEYRGKKTGICRAIGYGNDGMREYYTLTGESLKRQFLRSPLTYRRISSRYSLSRFHPVLRIWRPHQGIDYAALPGTPVVSIGDGTVTYAGWRGGYGRFVEIKHDEVYTSTYGHLSAYARGIRKGAEVKQGQVIGYVGSTGLATGPHLDFRIKRDNGYVNFLKLKFPVMQQITPDDWDEFKKVKKRWAMKLAILTEGFCIIEKEN